MERSAGIEIDGADPGRSLNLLPASVRSLVWDALSRRLIACLAGFVVAFLGLVPLAGPMAAMATPMPGGQGSQQMVEIGMVVVELSGLDMKNDAFNATFWVWALSDGEQGDVLESVDWANARSIETLNKVQSRVGHQAYELHKIRGVFQTEWDLRLFPVDRQNLRIRMESTAPVETSSLVFADDAQARSYVHPVDLSGWSVGPLQVKQGLEKYQSNFGYPQLAGQSQSSFSFLDFELEIQRKNLPKLFKLLAGAFAAVVLVIASYGFHFKVPTAIPARFGLLAGSVFAVVISLRFASSKVFDPPYLTVVDVIHLIVVLYIFCAIGASMLHFWTFDAGEKLSRRSRRIDCLFGLTSTVMMLAVISSIIARLFAS